MENDITIFRQIFLSATESISTEYFLMPVAGQDIPIYRERVYCYELYHQLRLFMPPDWPYTLAGEIDKSGHPLVRGENLDGAKPDLLVHIPGRMDHNLVAIEVKASNASVGNIKRDLLKLTSFCEDANYYRSFYLFFGSSVNETEMIIDVCNSIAEECGDSINKDLIDFYFHIDIDKQAVKIKWT